MKKLLTAIILVMALSHCNNSDDKTDAAKARRIKPGDRAGADTSMIDLEDAISAKEKIAQRWDNKEDDAEVANAGGDIEKPFRGFYLFRDGSMIKNPKDNMIFGTWNFDEKDRWLQFNLANGSTEKHTVQSLSFDKLGVKDNGENNKPVDYISDGFVHKDLMNEPFYLPNLQWRVRPKAPEDDAALRTRIKGCLHFYYLYYMDNYKRNVAFVAFYRLPTCFKWYAGGIHLIKENELAKSWTDIFYNAADASKAYIILDKMISKKYNWNKEEKHWVKQNADVLKQMEAKIDSL